jgi:hypothetical protein
MIGFGKTSKNSCLIEYYCNYLINYNNPIISNDVYTGGKLIEELKAGHIENIRNLLIKENFTILDFSRCEINDTHLVNIANALKGTMVNTIYLSYNPITTDGVKTFVEQTKYTNLSIIEFKNEVNNLQDFELQKILQLNFKKMVLNPHCLAREAYAVSASQNKKAEIKSKFNDNSDNDKEKISEVDIFMALNLDIQNVILSFMHPLMDSKKVGELQQKATEAVNKEFENSNKYNG